jgi:hypothetical protein
MHLEFFFDGKSGCKRILRTQGRNSWTLRFWIENKFLSIKPLNIARQYLASARLIRVKEPYHLISLPKNLTLIFLFPSPLKKDFHFIGTSNIF